MAEWLDTVPTVPFLLVVPLVFFDDDTAIPRRLFRRATAGACQVLGHGTMRSETRRREVPCPLLVFQEKKFIFFNNWQLENNQINDSTIGVYFLGSELFQDVSKLVF